MALTRGSVEIINEATGTSDGITVNTPDASSLPAALATLRGLTGFMAVDPVPVEEREIGKFVYKQTGEGEFEREFRVEVLDVPIADAMWTAKTPSGLEVTVYFRETRAMTPDEVAAAVALADVQAQRRGTER